MALQVVGFGAGVLVSSGIAGITAVWLANDHKTTIKKLENELEKIKKETEIVEAKIAMTGIELDKDIENEEKRRRILLLRLENARLKRQEDEGNAAVPRLTNTNNLSAPNNPNDLNNPNNLINS